MKMANDNLLSLLQEELVLLHKAVHNLNYSFERQKAIIIDESLSDNDYEILDSLSARFLRVYEVLINQVLRTVLQLLGEEQQTLMDKLNKAESLSIIESADKINTIRILRNKIANEYIDEDWIPIYKSIIGSIPTLLSAVDGIIQEVQKRKWTC